MQTAIAGDQTGTSSIQPISLVPPRIRSKYIGMELIVKNDEVYGERSIKNENK